LSATGRVTVPDGSTGCASGVRVKIQKAVGKHFHTIQEVITNGNGTYNKRLPNVSGFYRAKLPAQSSASGDGCLIAFSKTFAYAKG
jgi:5-hydroxyisourate hydrolase-like protein (transthyretin family)